VVIFAEDWYGNTKQSIGGNAENRQSIVFNGYIQEGTIQWNWQDGYVSFGVLSASGVMKEQEGFAVSVQSAVDPAASAATDENIPSGWVAVRNMTTKRAIYHYLKWHSTALFCNDFQDVGNERNIQYFDANRDSLFSAVNNLSTSALVGAFACDRQGKMWMMQELDSIENALSFTPPTNTVIFSIDNSNWMGDPILTERQVSRVSFLEIGGVAYYGPATGTFQAFMSSAPGSAPNYGGGVQRNQGLALTSQAELNTLSGNMFAQRNSRYPSITMNMVGNYRNLDIAPRQFVDLTLAATDTPRNVTFTDKLFSPFSVGWSYNGQTEILLPTTSLREVTEGFAGDSIIIPDVPPVEPEDGGSVDQPPLIVPPLPPAVIPPILAGVEYFAARYAATVLTAAVSSNVTLDYFRTNSTSLSASVGGQSIFDNGGQGEVWMVTMWVYARNDVPPFTAFTLDLEVYPCPGYTLDTGFDGTQIDVTSTLPPAPRSYMRLTSSPKSSVQYASKTICLPVYGTANFVSPLSALRATSSVDVVISASVCGIKLAENISTGSACKLT
jgi:hypothetical protein